MLTFDKHFYESLSQDAYIKALTDGRIFNPARPVIDEEDDKIPYIIITNDGGSNQEESKDCELEGTRDNVTISVLCVASDRKKLADLIQKVRDVIRISAEDWPRLLQYSLSAGSVQFDPSKPCQYQTLTYQCEIETT